jgi:hypothetical protein
MILLLIKTLSFLGLNLDIQLNRIVVPILFLTMDTKVENEVLMKPVKKQSNNRKNHDLDNS